MPPSFLLYSRAVCAGGAGFLCGRVISLCSFLPLRQWQWQWPAVRLFRFCATQRLGTRPLEKEESPVSTKRQLRIEGYSIRPALQAVSRLGYLVSGYRSDMRCECCLAWPDLTSTLTFRCWMRYGYGACDAAWTLTCGVHSKLPLLQLAVDIKSTSGRSKQVFSLDASAVQEAPAC